MGKNIIVLLILIVTYGVAADNLILDKTLKVKSGGKLSVDLETGGDLYISTWDKKKISVNAKASGMDKEDYPEIIFKKDGPGASLSTSFDDAHNNHSSHITFSIIVPEKFDLDLVTMGGDFEILNLNGNVEGRTMGGSLVLVNLKGTIDLTTMGGTITLKNSTLEGSVSTMGGRVLMENVSGGVKSSSMGGEVIRRNVEGPGGKMTGGLVEISTMGGSINVDDAPEGADVHTMGGAIRIKRAKQFVKAKTMGGNITIDEIEGWVDATTMGGDIKVEVVGKGQNGKADIKLSSMYGNVTLTVPKKYEMTFDLEIVNHQNNSEKGKIISDFDMAIVEEDEWRGDHGSDYRKSVTGKGSVGSGKNKITIITHSGDIIIKQK